MFPWFIKHGLKNGASLLSNEQRHVSVACKDITKQELKAFFFIFIVTGINRLPKIVDY